uniref:Secreted protein n=1 Tax=Anopheles coluzzii TaxID=1518534 RepID=A0A8W7PU04_ANOCL
MLTSNCDDCSSAASTGTATVRCDMVRAPLLALLLLLLLPVASPFAPGTAGVLDEPVQRFDAFHQIVHQIEQVRLQQYHVLRHRYLYLDHAWLVRFQRPLDGHVEPGPNEQLLHEQIAHHLLHMAVPVRERFHVARERLDEADLVALPVEPQCERFLARFHDFMSPHHKHPGDQFDRDAVLQQIDHQYARADELYAALQVGPLPLRSRLSRLVNVLRVVEIRTIVLLLGLGTVDHEHKRRSVAEYFQQIQHRPFRYTFRGKEFLRIHQLG